ncbi:hypothetical protein [Roseateles koreensis]|uniref:Uncharacterized protein n=1 Tax=Roseateles koreensis TaxID=2987526 RepID=A0ABT5KVT4_9BURK|nr:hypothetical protein [Roseateles koreensis]MDC8786550.1 hypothetical protein [Roseateles koreensis]
MNTQTQSKVVTLEITETARTSAPVELSLDQLQQVGGGMPRGGWTDETALAVAATTTAASAL